MTAFRRLRAALRLAAALAALLPGLKQASASLAEQYVCTRGTASYTVVVNPQEPGPATLYGPLDGTRPGNLQHRLLEETKAAAGFRYESGSFLFSGRFPHASLHIDGQEIPCRMEPEPGA